MTRVPYRLFVFFLAVMLAGSVWGCKKKSKPSEKSKAVRCADLADDLAGALQDAGMVRGANPDKAIAKFNKELRQACLDGKVPESVFQCLAKVEPHVFSKMMPCLTEDLRSLVPDLGEEDESGEGIDEVEGDSDDTP